MAFILINFKQMKYLKALPGGKHLKEAATLVLIKKQTLGRRGEDDLTRVRAKPLPVTPPSGLSTSKVNMASGSLTEVTAVSRDSGRSAALRNPPEVTEGPHAVFGVAAETGSGSGMPGEVNNVSGMQREACKPEVGSYTRGKR
jgi:hypothetical protein